MPGRNFGTLAALILIVAPVRGLRPVRAARLPTANVPKPTSETVPPYIRVFLTASIVDSRARAAAALEISALVAMCSISSVLFTKGPSYRNGLVGMSLGTWIRPDGGSSCTHHHHEKQGQPSCPCRLQPWTFTVSIEALFCTSAEADSIPFFPAVPWPMCNFPPITDLLAG